MEKLKLITMGIMVLGLFSCNGPNDKKGNDKINTDPRAGSMEADAHRHATDQRHQSDTADWNDHYDTNMNISPLYGNLDMTEQQINDYEAASRNYREDWTKKNTGNDVLPSDVQGILLHRDKSLRSILTDEQYVRYKEMASKARSNGN
jgi:hypothetical protein